MSIDDRIDLARRLMAMQDSLRDVMDACEMQARVCQAAGASGLALSVHMVRESVAVYSAELAKFVADYLRNEEFSDGIEED